MLHLFLYSIVQYYTTVDYYCFVKNWFTHVASFLSLFVIEILIQSYQASATLIMSSLAETFSSSPPTEATSMLNVNVDADADDCKGSAETSRD